MATNTSAINELKGKRVLIVEDDLNLGFLIMELLEENGLTVKLAKNGRKALEILNTYKFDLCMLDIMMPHLDGISLAKTMRQKQMKAPFLFLTAKSRKEDKLMGYRLGAEDYITKPFDEDELLCKINVILRRYLKEDYCQSQFKIGAFEFDYTLQELTFRGNAHRLTEKENEILKLLCLHKNQILRREDAVEEVYGRKDYFLGRSFDVFISRLRKLLSKDPNISIENVFKVGFILKVEE